MNPKISAIHPLFALVLFSACSHNVIMKPQAQGLSTGSYRSRMVSTSGPMMGMSLKLNQDKRFTFATMEGGCSVTEERGTWLVEDDVLSMKVEKSLHRPDCASPWDISGGENTLSAGSDKELNCPLRSITTSSFQMLNEEIGQGTLWTKWEKDFSKVKWEKELFQGHRLAND